MAEPLKNYFGPEIAKKIAGLISAVHPLFPADAFLRDALRGYEDLELMPRGWHLARSLRGHLPDDYPEAIGILLSSLGLGPGAPSKSPGAADEGLGAADEGPGSETAAEPPTSDESETAESGMASFLYLPFTLFVAEYGLDHFEESMEAQYELTQRFTAEFSIRPFLEEHPERTLDRLREWAKDPSPHVRRLVSEGTRPRLPWASRLKSFQADPRPVLELLELLKDDPELFVRRSVANSLNDIGKDHPDLLVETARRWLEGADENRRWLVRHALRSAVKRSERGALEVLGYGDPAEVSIRNVSFTPNRVHMGDSVRIALEVLNTGSDRQRLLADLRVHFVKASGRTSPRVFKLRTLDLAPGESAGLRKTISLADMSTRKHYTGTHGVEVVLNGRGEPLGSFELTDA
jgi:3-methyladenine DNA glycosylase AlkC